MRTYLIYLLGILSTYAEFLLVLKTNYQLFLMTHSVSWMMNQALFCVVCRDIFISTDVVLLLDVYLLYHVVIEIHTIFCHRNQSIVYVVCHIFDHMEYSWLQIFLSLLVLNITSGYLWLHIFSSLLVLNRNDPTCLGVCQKIVYIGLLSTAAYFLLVF